MTLPPVPLHRRILHTALRVVLSVAIAPGVVLLFAGVWATAPLMAVLGFALGVPDAQLAADLRGWSWDLPMVGWRQIWGAA